MTLPWHHPNFPFSTVFGSAVEARDFIYSFQKHRVPCRRSPVSVICKRCPDSVKHLLRIYQCPSTECSLAFKLYDCPEGFVVARNAENHADTCRPQGFSERRRVAGPAVKHEVASIYTANPQKRNLEIAAVMSMAPSVTSEGEPSQKKARVITSTEVAAARRTLQRKAVGASRSRVGARG
eukprot:TRINITY_DN677_c0_g1_i1.p1 TRINITY_DN677_c0_g1~~TRINITY_DN677_c0_g1_i1.p1  ORF type:complete len:180 (-),score=11.96 TRINITY_DN677_c0_g1_i1:1155-1694(-)